MTAVPLTEAETENWPWRLRKWIVKKGHIDHVPELVAAKH
jgi:hypothetical protein